MRSNFYNIERNVVVLNLYFTIHSPVMTQLPEEYDDRLTTTAKSVERNFQKLQKLLTMVPHAKVVKLHVFMYFSRCNVTLVQIAYRARHFIFFLSISIYVQIMTKYVTFLLESHKTTKSWGKTACCFINLFNIRYLKVFSLSAEHRYKIFC